MAFATHEDYFATVSGEPRARLQAIQVLVGKLIPSATRCISYSMPAYRDGKVFFFFASFKQHIGIYPPLSKDKALVKELGRFRGPKGNLSFPHGEPLPLDLIGRVAVALHQEHASKTKTS